MGTIKYAVFGLATTFLLGCAGDTVTEAPFVNADGTELIVIIDTDFHDDEIATIDVSAGLFSDGVTLDVTGRTDYPIQVSIEPASASRGDLPLSVSALGPDGGTLVSWQAVTRFVPGEVRYIVAALGRGCIAQQEHCEVGETGEALNQVCRIGADRVAECVDLFIGPGELMAAEPGPVFSGPSMRPVEPTCETIEGLPCRPESCPCDLAGVEPVCIRAFWACDDPRDDVEDARCEIDDAETVVWSRDGVENPPAECEGDPANPDIDGEQPKGLICRPSGRPGMCPGV